MCYVFVLLYWNIAGTFFPFIWGKKQKTKPYFSNRFPQYLLDKPRKLAIIYGFSFFCFSALAFAMNPSYFGVNEVEK